MKRFVAFGVLCTLLVGADALSAARAPIGRGSRGSAGVSTPTVTQKGNVGTQSKNTGLRPGVNLANQKSAGVAASAAPKSRGRAAALPAASASGGVTARAATKQKAINTGTKIAGATENIVVSEECKNKYYGCMDSFCMLDNTNGGRCMCSNRNAELETVLAEIQKLDEQSLDMATRGVENINMGENAAEIDAMVKNATNSLNKDEENTKSNKARKLNLDAWNTSFDDDEVDEVFGSANLLNNDELADKTGDALHSAVMNICVKQIPECSSSMNMLKMMYAQQIKSDCNAYENSLKQQKAASAKKLQSAQQAMRDAALEQYQNANKYDLSQCTIRFKECMQTTAGCGDDFSKCASDVALENAKTSYDKKSKAKTYTIKTGASGITVAESTYNTLVAKRVMCDNVTNQCQKVKDKVWNSFLVSVAPELKSAELIAESNIRMNCISDVSACFQQACKDTMDPNNPEGSYDMCLSRPETMKSVCKIQLESCEKAEPNIWGYIEARLASMRVDSCTKEFKACLVDENRCGKDYSQCMGLDTDTIISDMCPVEKLTACNFDQKTGKTLNQTEIAEKLDTILTGIMLNIDNGALTECQNALNAAMVKVCGDTETCDNLALDFSTFEANAEVRACEVTANGDTDLTKCYTDPATMDSAVLVPYQVDWDESNLVLKRKKQDNGGLGVTAKVVGLPDMNSIKYQEPKSLLMSTRDNILKPTNTNSKAEFKITDAGANASTKKAAEMINNVLERTVNLVKSDTKVKWCVEGRAVQGIKERGKNTARFPNLADNVNVIVVNSILSKMAAYNASVQKKYEDQVIAMNNKIAEQVAKIEAEAVKNAEDKKAATEASLDKQNALSCIYNYTTWDSARKCPKKWGGTAWIDDTDKEECNDRNHLVNAYIKEFTEDVATYDAATNTCKVQTVKYSCHNKDGGYYRSPWCIRTNGGTVMSVREIKMAQ